MPTLNFRYTGALAVICLALAPAAAHAQGFTVFFTPPTQTVYPGLTTTFSGTITNNTADDLYINADTVDPLGPGFVTDDTPFYNTFGGTPVLLASGQTYALTDLFTVTDLTAAAGTYQGQYAIYGGAAPDSTDQVGFQTFTVNSPVPEASTSLSFALLLAAGAAAWAVQRRKRSAAQS